MRGAENVFMGLLAALAVGLGLPASSPPAPAAEPQPETAPPAVAERTVAPVAIGSTRADVLAATRPVLERMRESVGLAPSRSGRGGDEKRLHDLVSEVQRPVKCSHDDVPRARHVDFILATVPDYVDSNTAWMADEVLGAIRAALPHDGYVLDRFYLPELPSDSGGQPPRPSTAQEAAVRLHESQPGVIIFRADCGWQVVLIALETATSGLHVAAFENAARFILLWQERTDKALKKDPAGVFRELRIVGPTFSGSVDFMVGSLLRLANTEPRPQSLRVISGSATADSNPAKLKSLCGRLSELQDCSYATAMHSNGETVSRLCTFLSGMNPSWVPRRVGVLVEFNTSFGMDFRELFDRCASRRYAFPLHIAQLRADARAAPALPFLLTSPAAALKLGERDGAVDLVPPLRPAVASPLTDQLIAAILDDIRHSGLAAVGIYATDVRDALFLSREVKRAAPDVQLFFPSAHLLYLHPDFVAYTRGAIVASTYPLSAFPQLWGGGTDGRSASLREVFPSTVAQGVFIATLTQARRDANFLPDYPYSARSNDEDSVGMPELGPKPGLWMSIVGDDGFWPLQQATYPAGVETRGPLLHGWPRSVAVASVVLLLIIGAHVAAFVLNWRGATGRRSGDEASWLDRLRGCAPFNALAPPPAFEEFARQHSLMSGIAYVLVGSLAFWMGTVIFVNWFGPNSVPASMVWLIPVAASTTIAVAAPARALSAWSMLLQPQARTMVQPIRAAEWLIGGCWLLPSLALISSAVATYWSHEVPGITAQLAAARTIGAGIASPGASTVFLLAALYVPVVWSLLRLRALGYGYTTLAGRSAAFRRLLGSEEGTRSFAALLDVPARHVPRSYFIAIAVSLSVVTMLLWSNVATVEGMAYAVFLGSASLISVASALALLAQSLEIWRRLRVLLAAMADLPLAAALSRVGMSSLQWHISIVPPDTRDLRVPLSLAADLRDQMHIPAIAALLGPDTRVALDKVLRDDGRERQGTAMPLTQSATWLKLWQVSDALLPLLTSCRWTTCGEKTRRLAWEPQRSRVSACLDCCETLMATLRALVLRDLTSRIMSGLFSALVILGLLAAAHLLYAFQGRASFLGLDVTMLALASVASVWILIGLEKDAILSLIWRTTPGRVSFNWLLVQRLVVYGVLPLLLVLGSMFPEVGETLVRLMEPLRKLTSL
jgi:hypothetical protein